MIQSSLTAISAASPTSRHLFLRRLHSGVRAFALRGALIALAACGGAESTAPKDPNTPGEATNLSASATQISLGAIGASSQITAQMTDAKGRVVPSSSISWSSSDITIVGVAGSGGVAIITARAPGRATVRVSGGGLYQDIPVTVNAARAISLAPATVTVRSGDSYRFIPTIDADPGASPQLQWSTDNPLVATVGSDGTVSGITSGNTNIRVTVVGDARLTATAAVVVGSARSVKLSPTTVSLPALENATIGATVDVDATQSKELTWTSDNASVATVSSAGVVTGVAVGSTFVRAVSVVDARARDSVAVRVLAARTVSVSPASVTFANGETRQLTATVSFEAGASTDVTWRSSNPAIAMVAQNGLITAVAQGSTTITAVAVADTTKRASAAVTVVPGVRDIDVQPAALSVFPGESRSLTANLTADNGALMSVTWRSSNAAVATVAANGSVTGVSAGTAIVTAISDADTTKRATSLVTVRTSPVVSITPSSLKLVLNEQSTLTASVTAPLGASTAVTWQSSNASVASISSSGNVTAIGFGTATVTATSVADPNARATASVVVAPQVKSISLSPGSALVAPGGTVQLLASVTAEGGLATTVTFRSTNPSVASVNYAGVVSAMSLGTATVTAVSDADTTRKASAVITVANGPRRLATSWSTSRLGGALYEDVVSISAVDASTAYAVNSVGDVFRYNGTSWVLSASGSSYGTQFLSVSAVSGAAVAVGTNGITIRNNGSSWSTMASGTSSTLQSVWLESASSGFAVGVGGVALRLTGTTWSATTSGSTRNLYGVWSSAGVAYAVGDNGEILKYSGSWTRQTSGTTETLYSVYGTPSGTAVAVGTFGKILRLSGTTWSSVSAPSITSDLYGVATDPGTGISYIASDVGLLQLNGSTVTTAATPYAPRLFATALDVGTGVWTSGQRGSVMRYASSSWRTLNLAPDLIDVWTAAGNNAWAVGEFGFTYRYNGTDWTRVSTPTTATLNAVWANATDAFAGGDNGTMLRWNGSSWSSMSFPSTGHVYGLYGTSGSNVYAVTTNGEILRFNGTSWTTAASAGISLWSIHGSSANDIVAVGENGTGLRFDGSTWLSMNVGTTGTLAGVYAGGGFYLSVGANSAGTGGLAYTSGGNGWSATSTGSSRLLTSAWGPSSSDLYATGEAGTMLRYNGTGWTSMSTGTSDLLWSVSGAIDGTGGFAVGYNSTMLTATSGSSLVAGMRAAALNTGASLEPRSGAKLVRGSLPTGTARRNRKR